MRGNAVVEPEEGPLACGMIGAGRLADRKPSPRLPCG
jgi:hypothetical protein